MCAFRLLSAFIDISYESRYICLVPAINLHTTQFKACPITELVEFSPRSQCVCACVLVRLRSQVFFKKKKHIMLSGTISDDRRRCCCRVIFTRNSNVSTDRWIRGVAGTHTYAHTYGPSTLTFVLRSAVLTHFFPFGDKVIFTNILVEFHFHSAHFQWKSDNCFRLHPTIYWAFRTRL